MKIKIKLYDDSDNETKSIDISEQKLRRMISEFYRDEFRDRFKTGTEANFMKWYASKGWTLHHYRQLKVIANKSNANKKMEIDHFVPMGFWIQYENGKYLDFCIHPHNIQYLPKDANAKKSDVISCLHENYGKYVLLANSLGVSAESFIESLNHYNNDLYVVANKSQMIENMVCKLENECQDVTVNFLQ